jgi:hypothetical protein
MPAVETAHPCPGGCGARLPGNRLACTPCWVRLPNPLRNDLVRSYRERGDSPMRHFAAVALTRQWYRDNPRTPEPTCPA